MKVPAIVFGSSLLASALGLWLIGFPGICGFTGLFGDVFAKTAIGFYAAVGLVGLPALGILVGGIWLFAEAGSRLWR